MIMYNDQYIRSQRFLYNETTFNNNSIQTREDISIALDSLSMPTYKCLKNNPQYYIQLLCRHYYHIFIYIVRTTSKSGVQISLFPNEILSN